MYFSLLFFFFNDTATTEIYTLSLHDALPISRRATGTADPRAAPRARCGRLPGHGGATHGRGTRRAPGRSRASGPRSRGSGGRSRRRARGTGRGGWRARGAPPCQSGRGRSGGVFAAVEVLVVTRRQV